MAKRQVDRKPTRGDLVKVYWIDITCQPTEHPKDADPCGFVTIAYFYDWHTYRDKGRCLRISDTLSTDKKPEPYGVTTIPRGCIRRIECLKT